MTRLIAKETILSFLVSWAFLFKEAPLSSGPFEGLIESWPRTVFGVMTPFLCTAVTTLIFAFDMEIRPVTCLTKAITSFINLFDERVLVTQPCYNI